MPTASPEQASLGATKSSLELLIERNATTFAQVKRFNERWQGDARFRARFESDQRGTLAAYQLDLHPEDVRHIWDASASLEKQDTNQRVQPSLVAQCLQELAASLEDAPKPVEVLEEEIDNGLNDRRYRAWRKRQVYRLRSQTVKTLYEDTGHFSCAFELSQGCSVGCWFCSLSAGKLESVYPYSIENSRDWQQLLQMLKCKLGPAVGESFCYWATDPLDNPDYERFADDFAAILGKFPQTTTAQAAKHPERVRTLLKTAENKGGHVRFSVTSLSALNKIHTEFTPTELLRTELVLQLEGSLTGKKSNAGRARDAGGKNPQLKTNTSDDTTPSCVSGFIINMASRRISLVSPCLPNERWIHGHRIHDEAHFKNTEDLALIIESLIGKHMPVQLSPVERIRFRPDLSYQELEHGFRLSTKFKHFTFRKHSKAKNLGSLIQAGTHTAGEITAMLLTGYRVPMAETWRQLSILFDYGFLDDEA